MPERGATILEMILSALIISVVAAAMLNLSAFSTASIAKGRRILSDFMQSASLALERLDLKSCSLKRNELNQLALFCNQDPYSDNHPFIAYLN